MYGDLPYEWACDCTRRRRIKRLVKYYICHPKCVLWVWFHLINNEPTSRYPSTLPVNGSVDCSSNTICDSRDTLDSLNPLNPLVTLGPLDSLDPLVALESLDSLNPLVALVTFWSNWPDWPLWPYWSGWPCWSLWPGS